MVSPLLSEQPICDTPRSERGLFHPYKSFLLCSSKAGWLGLSRAVKNEIILEAEGEAADENLLEAAVVLLRLLEALV